MPSAMENFRLTLLVVHVYPPLLSAGLQYPAMRCLARGLLGHSSRSCGRHQSTWPVSCFAVVIRDFWPPSFSDPITLRGTFCQLVPIPAFFSWDRPYFRVSYFCPLNSVLLVLCILCTLQHWFLRLLAFAMVILHQSAFILLFLNVKFVKRFSSSC